MALVHTIPAGSSLIPGAFFSSYMLLGERVRNPQEKAAVKAVIEEVMKVKLDEDTLTRRTGSLFLRAFETRTNRRLMALVHTIPAGSSLTTRESRCQGRDRGSDEGKAGRGYVV
jgi:hypothetical protein